MCPGQTLGTAQRTSTVLTSTVEGCMQETINVDIVGHRAVPVAFAVYKCKAKCHVTAPQTAGCQRRCAVDHKGP